MRAHLTFRRVIVLLALGTAAIAAAIPAGAALQVGGFGNDVLVGRDNDNGDNTFIQPPGVAAKQHLDNTDILRGGPRGDLLIGLKGSDLLLGEYGSDVGVVMLDGNDPLEPEVASHAGGHVAGVQVPHRHLGFEAEQASIRVEGRAPMRERLEILEISEREFRSVSLDDMRRGIAASVACRAAIKVNTPATLAAKVTALLRDRERLEALRANVRRIARPRAAFDVARGALEVLGGRPAVSCP